MGPSLVLNATYEPLGVVPARRAVVLVLAEKAEVIHHNGEAFRSEHLEIAVPSVIRLRYFVRVPYQRRAPQYWHRPPSRRNTARRLSGARRW